MAAASLRQARFDAAVPLVANNYEEVLSILFMSLVAEEEAGKEKAAGAATTPDAPTGLLSGHVPRV